MITAALVDGTPLRVLSAETRHMSTLGNETFQSSHIHWVPGGKEMAQAKTIRTLIVILTVLFALVIAYYFSTVTYERAGVELELEVTPEGVPRFGAWSVTTSLHNWSSGTRVIVDSRIVMTSTLDDGSRTIQTKNTSSGQASFSVPSNTVAVRFDATCQTYDASTTFSGPTIIGEGFASGSADAAVGSGFAYAVTAWFWYDGGKIDRRRCLVILPGLTVGVLSLAYIIQNYPTWYGSGWLPYSFIGIPVLWFSVMASILVVVTLLMARDTLKAKREHPDYDD